jgi:hypothetical protein
MITDPKTSLSLGVYDFEVALSKSRGGTVPLFNLFKQIQPASALLDTSAGSSQTLPISFRAMAKSVYVVWRLNANPFVRVVLGPSASDFSMMSDFTGFFKNNVIGVRLFKQNIHKESPWIYGTLQYAVPKMDTRKKSISVEGYGLLFEAPRRHVSRNFHNTRCIDIVSGIAKKYGLDFAVVGTLVDPVIDETEQNINDLAMIFNMCQFLNAFWYLDGTTLKVIGRDYMYSQTPEVRLFYGSSGGQLNVKEEFPLEEFVPELDPTFFEAGAIKITGRGIDLDSGEIVEKEFIPNSQRLGVLSLNSDQFRSDAGVTINQKVVKPAPQLQPAESGVFLPLRTRSNDDLRYRYWVEQKDIESRVTVKTVGAPSLRPGMMVEVQGVGELMGGNWVVEEVIHRVGDKKGYETSATLIRNALGQTLTRSTFKMNLKTVGEKVVSGLKKFAELVS